MTKPLKLDDLARAISGAPFPSQASLRKARAILTTIKQSGYAIVPVEADEATIRAVDKACHEHWPNARRMAVAMHAAMLSAAPVIEGE